MSTTVFRVEVFRDETRVAGGVTVEITAYIDRVPETDMAGPGYLARVPQSVWNTRMLYSGDFEELKDALAAIAGKFPEIDRIDCWEWPIDYENKMQAAPLLRSGAKWVPGEPPRFR
jgi:hypothetical protein